MTALHITQNPDGISGSQILCGAERNSTYRALAEGTADRYVDRFFVERPQYMTDPELCRDCLEVHDTMPKASLPLLLQPGADPADILRRAQGRQG